MRKSRQITGRHPGFIPYVQMYHGGAGPAAGPDFRSDFFGA